MSMNFERTYPTVEFEEVKDEDIELLHKMQVDSFMPLYEKYHDDMSPAIETVERIRNRAKAPGRKYFFIVKDGVRVGAVNIGTRDVNDKETYYISPIFILPEYQNQGIAYAAIMKAFDMNPEIKKWKLDTILQEKGNCHLYEKCGFVRVGGEEIINDKMTIVFYELNL